MLFYPSPNQEGVYNSNDAVEYLHENRCLTVQVLVLHAEESRWIYCVNFIRTAPAPYSVPERLASSLSLSSKSAETEFLALSLAKDEIRGYADFYSKKANSRPWMAAWASLESWSFNLGVQLDLIPRISRRQIESVA